MNQITLDSTSMTNEKTKIFGKVASEIDTKDTLLEFQMTCNEPSFPNKINVRAGIEYKKRLSKGLDISCTGKVKIENDLFHYFDAETIGFPPKKEKKKSRGMTIS